MFLFSHKKGATIRGKAIIRGRRLFQILLGKWCGLIFCFIFPWNKKKISMSKKLNRFSSSINFQSLNRHWSDLLNLIALHLDREEIKEREDGARGVGGAIIGGRRLIEGRLLFEEKRNTFFVLFFCLLLHRLAVRISLPFHIFYMFNCTDPGLQLGDPAPFIGLVL